MRIVYCLNRQLPFPPEVDINLAAHANRVLELADLSNEGLVPDPKRQTLHPIDRQAKDGLSPTRVRGV